MRRLCVSTTVLGLLASSLALAQGGTPGPDVFLVAIRMKGLTVELTGTVRNATSRPGYDNQPSWSPDGKSVYYTSTREDAQADIYRIDVASGVSTRITRTAPESEYSATVMADGKGISVIRVELDSAQRLWRFPLDGTAPSVMLPALKPTGYQAWASPSTVAIFVLGSPNALAFADLATNRVDTVARNIGRSLHRIPGTAHISFSQNISDTESWIQEFDPASRTITRRARLPAGVEDYAWTPDGGLVAGDGSKIVVWSSDAWQVVGDLAQQGISGITRLAVSPDGKWIAVVGVPAAAK
jgi:dipeptidyl aminopeptidase/acylaminoacyl peptidase